MRKLFLALGVVGMIGGMSSCNHSSKNAGNLENLEDSLAYFMGYANGGFRAQQMSMQLSEEEQAEFNKAEFLKGFKQMLMTDTNDVSYLQGIAEGWQYAQQLNYWQNEGLELDRKAIYEKFAEAFNDDSLTHEKVQIAVGTFQMLMAKTNEMLREKRDAESRAQLEAERQARQETANKNMADGKEFVEKAKANDKDIKTTESGLSYKVIKDGTGAKPKANDRVKVHYTGKLIDGTVFDSSVDRGEPIVFGLQEVIPGWTEGLQLMSKGSQYEFYIPANLAYGDNQAGQIPPGSTLIFTVELIDIEPTK